ncbi:MAG: TRAP transporter substrate-binding protein [Pseudomonadota bacterium]
MRGVFLSLLAAMSAAFAPTAWASCDERSEDIVFGRAMALAPPGTPWDDQWQIFKANVSQDPTMCFDYFTRGERRSEEQMFHDIRRGRAHVGGMSFQSVTVVAPEMAMAIAPFVFDSAEEVDFVYDEYLLDVANELMAEKNLVILQWVEVGWMNLYANDPILTPEDLSGRKMRGSPSLSAQLFLEMMNADSIPVGAGDIIPALQTGLVEGGLSSTVFHFFQTRKFASDFTLTRHAYDTGAIVVNKDWFDGLTTSQQQTLKSAWPPSAEARQGVRDLVGMALSVMTQEGVEIHQLTDEQRTVWREASAPIAIAMAERIGPGAQKVIDAINAGKAAFRGEASVRDGS